MQISSLCDFIAQHRRLFVLTGAGCSTDSGIPDYRDANGGWKRSPPVSFQAFMGSAAVRQRYWARSFVGWQHFRRAGPNRAHEALARLEQRGRLQTLVTQNVDGLHQAAGSMQVIDLHGRLDTVRCMECEGLMPREQLQAELLERNPGWDTLQGHAAPAGYRFVQAAAQSGKPVAAVNLGRTRADELLTLKVSEPCALALAALQVEGMR